MSTSNDNNPISTNNTTTTTAVTTTITTTTTMTAATLAPTTNNSTTNEEHEIESQFILRMPTIRDEATGKTKPHPITIALKEALAKLTPTSSEEVLKDRLFIEINTDTRKGQLKFDNQIFDARLVDLPCIIESLKTYDKKTFYKITDICQMLVCKSQGDKWDLSSDSDADKKKSKKNHNAHHDPENKKYQWSHGIAPPLKNVRRKRFRKVAKKKMMNYEEIQKELKKLFRADREATEYQYEEVFDYVEEEDDEDERKEDDLSKNKISLDDDDEYEEMDDDDFSNSQFDENSQSKSERKLSKPVAKIKNTTTKLKKKVKSKDIVDESNLSSDIDEDGDESTLINRMKKSEMDNSNNTKTDLEDTTMNQNMNFDELTNDDISLSVSKKKKKNDESKNKKSVSGVVEEIFGDLSSSEDEDDEDEEGEVDDDGEDFSTATAGGDFEEKKKTFGFSLDKKSVHFSGSITSKSKKGSSGFKRHDSDHSTKSSTNFQPDEDQDSMMELITNIQKNDETTSNTQNMSKTLTHLGLGFDDLDSTDSEENTSEKDSKTKEQNYDIDSYVTKKMMTGDEAASSSKAKFVVESDAFAQHQSTIDDINNLSLSTDDDHESYSELFGDNKSSQKNDELEKLQSKLNELNAELAKVQEKRIKSEEEISKISNPALKDRLKSKLDILIEEENKYLKEIEEVNASINNQE